MVGTVCFAGVGLLTLVAPFEWTAPLLRLPRQSVSNLEAAVVSTFVSAGIACAASLRLPEWRTPLTWPWAALLLAMLVASVFSPVSRINALHLTGRFGAAFGIYILAVTGIRSRARLTGVLLLALPAASVVSVLAILEYRGLRPVLAALTAFRPFVATVGAQVRASSTLAYPTIASMYLEVVFALGLGLLLMERDRARHGHVAAVFAVLAIIAEAITLTFTRAGLITMTASLLLVGGVRRWQRGRDAGTPLLAGLGLVIVLIFVLSRSTSAMWLRLTTEGQQSWYRATVAAPATLDLPADRITVVPLVVTNTGRLPWDSHATPPMRLSYHWLAATGDRFVIFEGERTSFTAPVLPDTTVSVDVHVRAPGQPGPYRLEWDVVQEGRLWFSTEPGAVRTMTRATVSGATLDQPAITTPPPNQTVRPGRLVLWRAAFRIVATHPWLGIGPDNFRLAYGTYAGLPHADDRTHSNNMYLEMLAGGGLLVAIPFAWLLWRTAGCAIALVRGSSRGGGAASLGVAAALLAIAVHASVDSFLSFAPTYVIFSLTLGCAVACAQGMETWPDANRV